ncbi:hypothetical protein HY085_02405 [Candidatus Gottesmanbacteria bacterium]|nr:hypothetical protein [Candidatus Gottesmanbacteria bacterium]
MILMVFIPFIAIIALLKMRVKCKLFSINDIAISDLNNFPRWRVLTKIV